MSSIGEKTLEAVNLHNKGLDNTQIALILGISPRSVEKRLVSYNKFINRNKPVKNINLTWETEQIKQGFERFITENGHLPTADEVDKSSYLPSARQIQRRYGGLEKLRHELGYSDVHFGRGEHRSKIQKLSRSRGNNAEKELYFWLVKKFGEPFIHSEKEYGDIRNRADFLVYAQGITVGIDVFSTNTLQTLRKNVDLKAKKYIRFPENLPLLFIVWDGDFTQDDINRVCRTTLRSLPNLRVMTAELAKLKLKKLTPLALPFGFKPMIKS